MTDTSHYKAFDPDLEPEHLRGILREIWHICHVPTKDTPYRAYTHFQADFDRIRALCEPYVDDQP